MPLIFRRAIDQKTYETPSDRLWEEHALAELELNDSQIDASDVEGILAFAENALVRAGSLECEHHASPSSTGWPDR